MNLNSQKYPDITYDKGDEIYLKVGDAGLPFSFDVEEELTESKKAMAAVAGALDNVDAFTQTAKAFLKAALRDMSSDYHEVVADFMAFHKEELDPDDFADIFSGRTELSFEDMVDYLKIRRFGSLLGGENDEQQFIIDLSLDPDVTDELLVIWFDLNMQVVDVAHES